MRQNDVVLTKEQLELTKQSTFEEENMQTQYGVLVYKIGLNFMAKNLI